MAVDAARALIALAKSSGVDRYCHDLYHAGVFYTSFPDIAAAKAYSNNPYIDSSIMFKVLGDVQHCGEYAVNAVARLPATTIAVVDIVTAATRVTLIDGEEPPHEESIELVPLPLAVEDARPYEPTERDQRMRDEIVGKLKTLLASDDPLACDRRVYYSAPYTSDEIECIDDESFTDTLNSLQRMQVCTLGSLEYVRTLQQSHDPTTSVVLWINVSDRADMMMLVPRLRAATS